MIRRRGRLARALSSLRNAGSSIADGARGLWHHPDGRKWMVPLLVFLCLTGLLLVLAASVEVLAPFVYAIF